LPASQGKGRPATTRTGLGQEELRRNNISQLLTRVHVSGPTSRTALTRELGLNRSTIGDLAGALGELGLVTETQSQVVGRTGRPSLVVTPRSDTVVVAVDLGVDRIAVALVALGGEVMGRLERAHQRGEHDVEHVVESVTQMVTDLLDGYAGVRCLGLGIAVPGTISSGDGVVRFAPNLGWVNAPLAELLTGRVGLPVHVGNDANLGVLAEHVRGAARDAEDVAYLSGSVGIGGGFLVGGQLLSGAHGYAGEIGHILVDGNGPRCRCGNIGCWEMKVGENQLLTRAGRLPGGGPVGVTEVIEAAAAGETRARDAVNDVADWIGVGLRAVINLFNPEIIVLGGSLAQVWEAQRDRIDGVLDRWSLMSPRSEVIVRAAQFGQDSPLIGAAELALEPVLTNPMIVSAPRVAGGV
jgi:predicted NBD/HSP70 family sugar kinase